MFGCYGLHLNYASYFYIGVSIVFTQIDSVIILLTTSGRKDGRTRFSKVEKNFARLITYAMSIF